MLTADQKKREVVAAALYAGDLVYRVIEIDPPGVGPSTWKVASVVVARASAKQIKIATHFYGLFRTQFHPSEFNCVFFATPLQAIQHFLTTQQVDIESFDRRRRHAERAIAWATSQEGVTT
jgi:hypothetical protein